MYVIFSPIPYVNNIMHTRIESRIQEVEKSTVKFIPGDIISLSLSINLVCFMEVTLCGVKL